MAGVHPSTLSPWTSSIATFSDQKSSKAFNFSSSFFSTTENHASFRCAAKKKVSFTDQILDYIEGGPKLRRWYGAPDLLPKDGSIVEEEEKEDPEETRDAVLVTDGDSEIGQMVILSLIVKRARVKALVKDKRAALEAFGTYVESMAGDAKDKPFFKRALRGVRTIICPNLSVYKGAGGIQALMKSNAKKQAEQDELILMASGIPYTIVRAGLLENTPGGKQGFSFEEGCAARGSLSKEDAAFICVEAIDAVPQQGFTFEVVNGEENVLDWKEYFTRMMEKAGQKPQ